MYGNSLVRQRANLYFGVPSSLFLLNSNFEKKFNELYHEIILGPCNGVGIKRFSFNLKHL